MKWLVIFISFFLIYCEKDNLKQDPLEGQPDRIRNGNPADLRKPDNRPACSRDSLVIEANPAVGVFEEGQLGKITFSGRVLDCGTKEYEIEILNKPNEADFNNGIFEYLPPETLVQGNDLFIQRQLKVRMKTISNPVVIRDQLFTYFVRRPATRKPIIERVENIPFDLEEGESKQIFVMVRDEDSSSEKGGIISPPRLNLVTTVHNETNALPYMSIFNFDDPFQDPNDPLLWRFTVNINTKNYKNVVDRDREVHFGLMAISQFGVISDIDLHSFTILNRVKEPRITWPETGEFKHVMIKGQKNTFTFWAIDPLREGFTEAEILTNCNELPGEAVCECKYIGNAFSSSREKGSFCSIYWAIPADYKESKADFKIRITNTNFSDKQDVQVVGYTRTLFLEDGPGFPKLPLPPVDDKDETPEPPVQPEPNKPPGDQRGPVGFGSTQGDSL